MKYQLPLILFDPECPLCLRFKQGLEFLDKNLMFVSAREDDVYAAFPELKRQTCLEQVHMITADETLLQGSEVVDELMKTLPGISKFAWLLDNDQGRKAKDYFYQKVEELRDLSKKKNEGSCNQCPRK
ncbi:MAG TPA: DCC1-like thiol-disulfide oxidoreductase family protein [Bacteriovoracaceae bacterium]|nr:DCC1-like thiol-disulfide oxidoreductase family protein [Bacteriovoracaceae bacterium]